MNNFGILQTVKLLIYAFILTLCTSCTESNYKDVDKILLIEFSSVNVDSVYLMKGFNQAQISNGISYKVDSANNQFLSDSNVISLEDLDGLEDNFPPKIVFKPPKNQFHPPTKTNNADKLHQLYRDFDKAVFEGKIKLKIIDTTKKTTKNGRIY